jgi:hypothetical protein
MNRNRSIETGQGARGARGLTALALAVLLGAGQFVRAGDDGASESGGGDTVGSLPLLSSNGPPLGAPGGGTTIEVGPTMPIATLSGPREAVLAAILDAYPTGPDGQVRLIHLWDGEIRVEFYGRVCVVLDRQLIQDTPVRAEVVVGSTFAGGIAQYRVGGQLRATDVLELGAKDFRLSELDRAGVLVQGLNWHGVSPLFVHRVIAIQAAGNLISIQQRD